MTPGAPSLASKTMKLIMRIKNIYGLGVWTLKLTTTPKKCSVLKAFSSATKMIRIVLQTFHSVPKAFCFVLKAFRSVKIVQIVSCKAFRPKRSEVFRNFHCHYQNGELTMKSKAHPFISRIIFLFHIYQGFFCETVWPIG